MTKKGPRRKGFKLKMKKHAKGAVFTYIGKPTGLNLVLNVFFNFAYGSEFRRP